MKTVLIINDKVHTIYNPRLTYADYSSHQKNDSRISFDGEFYVVDNVSVSLEKQYTPVDGSNLVSEVLTVKLVQL